MKKLVLKKFRTIEVINVLAAILCGHFDLLQFLYCLAAHRLIKKLV